MEVGEQLIGGLVPELLTAEQVQVLLGCSERQLRLWRLAGLPTRGRRGHRQWYAREDLEAFLAGRS